MCVHVLISGECRCGVSYGGRGLLCMSSDTPELRMGTDGSGAVVCYVVD